MNSNCERKLIEQVEKAYSFRRDMFYLLLAEEDCELFLEENNVIYDISSARKLGEKYICRKYSTESNLNLHLLEKSIAKHFKTKLLVRCQKKDIYEFRNTGRRIPVGAMGAGEMDEIVQVRTSEEIHLCIEFTEKSTEFKSKEDPHPEFVMIQKSLFNKAIHKKIYDLISVELSHIIQSSFKEDCGGINRKFDLFRVLSVSEEQCNIKVVKFQMRIFSTIDNEIINMLKEFKYTYIHRNNITIPPIDITVFEEHTFRIISVTNVEKEFLNITLEEVVKEKAPDYRRNYYNKNLF